VRWPPDPTGRRRTVDDVPRISAGLVVYRWAPGEPVTPDGPGWIAPEGLRTATEPAVAGPTVVPDERVPLVARAPAPSVVRRAGDVHVEVLCVHMGGPLWARKDDHAWSFPKGELEEGEDEPAGARREFAEELGLAAPDEPWWRLGEYRYSSGKRVVLFAVEADLAVDAVRPGTFEMEWPPRSGRRQEFPEVDRVAWFDVPTARTKLVAGQVPALDDLERRLAAVG